MPRSLFVSFSSDLAFDVGGYTFILLNDAFTAASSVYTKKKLGIEVTLPASCIMLILEVLLLPTNYVYLIYKLYIPFSLKGLGKYGVLFYNALIIVIPTILASAFTGDLHKVCSSDPVD